MRPARRFMLQCVDKQHVLTYSSWGNIMTPEQVARDVSNLVSLPRAYHRISEMLENPHYGSADIGKVIAHDPALTARALRLVNSAHYALASKVSSIPQAITILGS